MDKNQRYYIEISIDGAWKFAAEEPKWSTHVKYPSIPTEVNKLQEKNILTQRLGHKQTDKFFDFSF